MPRSPHWRDAIPHIQEWVQSKFDKSGKSLWDCIDGRVSFGYVGINRQNFLAELAPKIAQTKKEGWDDIEWWEHVQGRIYYFFHYASQRKPRVRCWAEWPGPIPLRPEFMLPAPPADVPPLEVRQEEMGPQNPPFRMSGLSARCCAASRWAG